MQPADLVRRLNAAVPSASEILQQYRPIADGTVASLIEAFQSASAEERRVARAELSNAARLFLLDYAWDRAQQAIRQDLEKW
jgi:hypothetical protein